MEFSIVTCFIFISLSACIWACAWLASKEKNGWGWILFAILLIYGSVKVSVDTEITCPKCNHYFIVGKSDAISKHSKGE